jgi:hypothetical protein
MEVYEITFDGSVLRRGFWIYVWAVKTPQNGNLIYVGRTGDTSSPFAQSPFRRIGQHVDPNPKSKSNALARHLRKLVIAPEECKFKFTAIGPVFSECADMNSHLPVRDSTAALERNTADWFNERGYRVLGDHPKRRQANNEIWHFIREQLSQRFPNLIG